MSKIFFRPKFWKLLLTLIRNFQNFRYTEMLCEITPFGRVFHIMWRGYLRCSTISRPPVVTSHNSGYPKFLYANPTGFAPRNSGLSAPRYTQFKKYFSFYKEFWQAFLKGNKFVFLFIRKGYRVFSPLRSENDLFIRGKRIQYKYLIEW